MSEESVYIGSIFVSSNVFSYFELLLMIILHWIEFLYFGPFLSCVILNV